MKVRESRFRLLKKDNIVKRRLSPKNSVKSVAEIRS